MKKLTLILILIATTTCASANLSPRKDGHGSNGSWKGSFGWLGRAAQAIDNFFFN